MGGEGLALRQVGKVVEEVEMVAIMGGGELVQE